MPRQTEPLLFIVAGAALLVALFWLAAWLVGARRCEPWLAYSLALFLFVVVGGLLLMVWGARR